MPFDLFPDRTGVLSDESVGPLTIKGFIVQLDLERFESLAIPVAFDLGQQCVGFVGQLYFDLIDLEVCLTFFS